MDAHLRGDIDELSRQYRAQRLAIPLARFVFEAAKRERRVGDIAAPNRFENVVAGIAAGQTASPKPVAPTFNFKVPERVAPSIIMSLC
jgi:hypothetical protein